MPRAIESIAAQGEDRPGLPVSGVSRTAGALLPFAGRESGHSPLRSSGPEPEFTSRDELVVLNTGDAEARLALTIFYADRDPTGPYELTVAPRRVRRVRCNDLIDPEAMPLGVDYGVLVESNVPVVVQFTRIDTSQPALAMLGLPAFSADG